LDGAQALGHAGRVQRDVDLGPARLDGEALPGVQPSELDRRRVGDLAHRPAERVNLPHEAALRESTDRGIAGQPADLPGVERHERDPAAELGRGQRGLTARVTRANNDDVEAHRAISRKQPSPYRMERRSEMDCTVAS